MTRRRRILRAFCLASLTSLATGLVPAPIPIPEAEAGEEQQPLPPDLVVAVTGERIPCTILAVEGPLVRVRIGSGTYVLERAALSRIERAGTPELDASTLEFVRHLARHLAPGSDPALAEAARVGLKALGDTGLPYLEAAGRESDPDTRSALEALAREVEAAASDAAIEEATRSAQEVLGLSAEQEQPVRDALRAFLAARRGGVDPEVAEEGLRRSLQEVLTPMQGATLKGWLAALRMRGSAP